MSALTAAAGAPSTVELHLDPSAARRWQLDLATTIETRLGPGTVAVRWAEGGGADPRAERLLDLERRLHGVDPGGSTPVDTSRFGRFHRPPGTSELHLDLAGSAAASLSPVWRLRFDGATGDRAAVAAPLGGCFPVVSLVTGEGDVVAVGRPGSESPGVRSMALDDVLAGCVQLVLAALDGHRPALPSGPPPQQRAAPPRSTASVAARAVLSHAAHRAHRALYRTPHWRVGWRFVDDDAVVDRGELPATGWSVLPDDGRHFYADPFPFTRDGRTWLFVEDFDHDLGRGVISVVDVDGTGPVGTPRPVLRHAEHLSYPLVLEDQGEIWMVPETSAAGTIELYRATRFPDAWVREAVLVRDVVASDATCFRHEGRWWMTATVRHGGSWSDALHVWHADRLCGPWQPHRGNPVLVDISCARPAGHVVRRGGRLLRPTQDGTRGYGSGLALAEIEQLDEGAFRQRVVARLTPGERWAGRRLHTLNRAGRLECIDGSASSPRFRRPRS
jgi:hypothetical protein